MRKLREAWARLNVRIFGKRMATHWNRLQYECGFTGRGPTAFDTEPTGQPRWVPGYILREMEDYWRQEREIRSQAFRQACIDGLGEDPDEDWI